MHLDTAAKVCIGNVILNKTQSNVRWLLLPTIFSNGGMLDLFLQHGLDALPGFSAFTSCIESVSPPSLAYPFKYLEDDLKPKMYCKVQLQDPL